MIKIKSLNFFAIKIYYFLVDRILKRILDYISFPIIDTLPKDICEYLQIDKSEYIQSLKTLNYIKSHDGWQKDYDKWLKNSLYYFYDLPIFHRNQKAAFIMDAFLQYFQPKNLKILDFGSGIGTRSLIYAKRNKVTLVEINEKLLDFSKWRFKKYYLKGNFYTQIPKEEKYDIIMLLDVIGHLTDPIKIINKICSSLNKNGILRITFDNRADSEDHIIHRNKEIDFHKIFEENGLKKIFKTRYRKI